MIELAAVSFSIVSAAVGAILARHLTSRRERVSTTMRLFERFYEPEMHADRVIGAKYLLNNVERATFNTMWDHEDTLPVYRALSRTVYFWFELSKLESVGMIDRRLAQRAFRYPYEYWKPLLTKLYADTIAEGSDQQDWLSLVANDELEWLTRS